MEGWHRKALVLIIGLSAATALGCVAPSGPARRTAPSAPAASAAPTTTSPTADPSPSASASPTRSETVADRLRALVIDGGSEYSGRIDLRGNGRAMSGGSTVRSSVTGTVEFSDRDFAGRERTTTLGRTDELAIVMAGGRLLVRRDGGPWRSATTLPETFVGDPLSSLLRSHELDEIGGSTRSDLVRLRRPIFEAAFSAIFARSMGSDWQTDSVTSEVVLRPDGTPAWMDIAIEGDMTQAGRRVAISMELKYSYRDIGQAIAIEAPRVGS